MSAPFIHAEEESRTYYLTGTGGRLYKSKDLKMWTGPYHIIDLTGTWMDGHFVAAAEIHRIGGRYYLAGTWNEHGHLIENIPRRYNVPEWTQLIDGTMAYMPLSKDLTRRTAEPTTIFRASEAPWSKEMNSIGEATFGLKMPGWVTDGPQLFRTQTGRLGMLWSSWGEHRGSRTVRRRPKEAEAAGLRPGRSGAAPDASRGAVRRDRLRAPHPRHGVA